MGTFCTFLGVNREFLEEINIKIKAFLILIYFKKTEIDFNDKITG
jgi:hypothetical protein